jgi:hypothetical protein
MGRSGLYLRAQLGYGAGLGVTLLPYSTSIDRQAGGSRGAMWLTRPIDQCRFAADSTKKELHS